MGAGVREGTLRVAPGVGAERRLLGGTSENGPAAKAPTSRAGRPLPGVRVLPGWAWTLVSVAVGVGVWLLASARMPAAFATPAQVVAALSKRLADGTYLANVGSSLTRVLWGFGLAFVTSIPVAFLMAWHDAFRRIVEPWVWFVRNIPPLAYVFVIIAALGIGETSKVAVIFIASFLIMVVTMYQGVRNVDPTLLKAARVLGARPLDLFWRVTVPASAPFVFVSARLGLSAALTTLMASEIVGGSRGVGVMIQQASGFYQMDVVLLGVLTLGVIGVVAERVVRVAERRLTGWQETLR